MKKKSKLKFIQGKEFKYSNYFPLLLQCRSSLVDIKFIRKKDVNDTVELNQILEKEAEISLSIRNKKTQYNSELKEMKELELCNTYASIEKKIEQLVLKNPNGITNEVILKELSLNLIFFKSIDSKKKQ